MCVSWMVPGVRLELIHGIVHRLLVLSFINIVSFPFYSTFKFKKVEYTSILFFPVHNLWSVCAHIHMPLPPQEPQIASGLLSITIKE